MKSSSNATSLPKNTTIPQSTSNKDIQKEVNAFSYFYQPDESDEKIDNGAANNKLCYPEIHHHIFSFLDQKELKKMSLINKATKNFIDGNIGRHFSIQLSYSSEIDEFIAYLQDSGNNILLKKLKTLYLDIDLFDEITGTLYQLGSSRFNLLRLPFTSGSTSEISRFQRLIEQLKLAQIKNLRLKFENIDVNYIKYLANSELCNLTYLDLSENDVGISGVTGLVNGNLNLAVLVLNVEDHGVTVFDNQKSKTSLYLSCTYADGGTYVGELKDGKPHGHGTYTYVDGIRRTYVGDWQDGEPRHGTYTYANGETYVGDWQDGKPHGHGTSTYVDGIRRTYVGDWQDGKPRHGTLTFANGDEYVGDWQDDKPHGHGTLTFANGEAYDGDWQDDKMHGHGTYTYANGETYVGDWQDDKRHGHGTLTFANGDAYDGNWQDDKMHGHGTLKFANCDAYYGDWQDDKMHGHGTFTYVDGIHRTYVGDWQDDKMHGHGKLTFANGDAYDGDWQDDKMHGHGTYTYANGETYDGDWQDDKPLHGTYTYADGRTYVGDWQDGKMHGHGTYTYANGETYVGDWQDDKMHGHGTYTYANGGKFAGVFINDLEWEGFLTYPDNKQERWENGKKVR